MHSITSFTVTPSVGDVYATEFSVFVATTGTSIAKYNWNFGDGTSVVYNNNSPKHVYNYPGTYTIGVTAIDFDGFATSLSQQITADLVYRDYLRFTQIPDKYPDPGKLTTTPFKIEIVCSQPEQPLVADLFATNSNSTPLQFVPQRWNFLNPTWKFLDKDYNFVTTVTAEPIKLYKNNKVVGVSGTAEFYYVDSTSTFDPLEQCPILITATLQTSGFYNYKDANFYSYPSYANNQTIRSGVLWVINDILPNVLKVTSNYIDKIQSPQWVGIPIPTLITCHSNRNLLLPGSEDSISEILFTHPESNTIGLQTPVNLTLTNLLSNEYSIDEAPLYFQKTDKDGFDSGGYIFTTVTCFTTALSTSIAASSLVYSNDTYIEDEFVYPKGIAPNTSIWVSNPERNTLNKITLVPYNSSCPTIDYYINNGILVDGQIKEVEVPHIKKAGTSNYSLSGFSGIYGIAIDPRKYEVIACDSELDRLYRISNSGEILKTFELSSLGDYDPFKKMLDYWHYTTPLPQLSSTIYALYNPTFLSENIANYIISIGGVVQPIPDRFIDKYDRICRLLVSPNYPPGYVNVDIVQIFNPTLPTKYISTLAYWTTSYPTTATSFPLLSAPALKSNTSHYFVTIDGIVQNPQTYTVDISTNTVFFSEEVQPNLDIQVLYIPEINNPVTKTYTFTNNISALTLTDINDDPESSFIVAIGGVFQSPQVYKYNYSDQTITFASPVPGNTQIQITQLSIDDSIYAPAAYTPSYISLDKDYNIWVSLYNSISVLKFDENFNLLHNVIPSGGAWQYEPWTVFPEGIDHQFSRYAKESRYIGGDPNNINPNVESLDRYMHEYFFRPPVVETDKENNCWVTYSHPLCSILAKYSSNGQLINQINLPKYSIPVGLAINSKNNVWVTNTHNSSYLYTSLSGSLQLYNSTTAQLLSTVTGISRPQYIALDRQSNVWFTHGQRRLGYFNPKTSQLLMWNLTLSGTFEPFEFPTDLSILENFDQNELELDEDLNGLAVDVYNRVWVIDGALNNIWVLSATPSFSQAPIRYFKVRPNSTIGYYIDLQTDSTYTESIEGSYYRSAQATGDWTGNRWYQKYMTAQLLSGSFLSGVSEPFSITPYENPYNIRRVNESFNASEYMHSLALPENLYNNQAFFTQFLAAAAGTGQLSAYEDIGQIIYEKIANFVLNHGDVDTCNVDQLLSLANATDTPASDYGASYPQEIKRLIDIASINRTKLWGLKDAIPVIPRSTGNKLNTQTSYITAGTKIILRGKFDNTYSLIPVPPLESNANTLVYPLSEFVGYGFVQPILINYEFFDVNPLYDNTYLENIIDWDSPLTTLNPTSSSFAEWYGPEGAIETMFRYTLTKNLF